MGNGTGLKPHLGLKDPQAPVAASSQQANQFKSVFQGAMKTVNQSLTYTTSYAEKSKHQAVASKKNGVIAAYQSALAKIDPTDESKAQRDINRATAMVNSLASEATKLKQDTETAYKAWKAEFVSYEKSESQVEELDIWDEQTAKPFLAIIATIRDHENARRWVKAKADLYKLLQGLQPAYKEYVRQKAAKDNYDLQRPKFDSEFKTTRDHPKPTPEMSTLQKQIETSVTAIDGAVKTKDYVSACKQLDAAAKNVEKLKKARAEHEKREKEYQKRLPAVQTRVDAASSGYDKLMPLEQKIIGAMGHVKAAAATGDYKAALDHLSDVEKKLDKLETDRAELDKKWAILNKATQKKRQQLRALKSEIAKTEQQIELIEWQIAENLKEISRAGGRDGAAGAGLGLQVNLAMAIKELKEKQQLAGQLLQEIRQIETKLDPEGNFTRTTMHNIAL